MESALLGREVPESSKLQGPSNYALWAFKVRTVLQRERLWTIVSPDSLPAPGDSTAHSGSTSATTHSSTPAPAQLPATAGLTAPIPDAPSTPPSAPPRAAHSTATSPSLPYTPEDLRYKAIGIIVPTLSDSLVPHIMNLTDPRLVWVKLRDLFESKSMNRRMTLKSQLYSLKMSEKSTVEEHLRNVSSLLAQLANIGTLIPDEEIVDRVLTSLPASWSIFRQMICGREHPLSFLELEALLIQEDGVRARSRDQEDDEALLLHDDAHFVRFQQPSSGRSNFRTRSAQRGRPNSFSRPSPGRRSFNPAPTSAALNYSRSPACSPSGLRPSSIGNGTCNECGSPDHWADRCEIRHFKNKIRELELSAPTWKRKEWAHSVDNPASVETTNDVALAQVIDVCAAEITSQRQPDDWFIDSGASAHVTGDRTLISDVRSAPQSNVTTAGGRVLPIMGQGSANLDKNKEIQRVLYVPGMCKNLLSVGKFADAGHYTLFGPHKCWIFAKDNPRRVLFTGSRSHTNSLYRLNSSLQGRAASPPPATATANALQASPTQTQLWHHRTSHLNYQSLYHLSKRDMVTGLPPLPLIQPSCAPCIMGKQHRSPIPKASKAIVSDLLQIVHSDLCGPLPHRSLQGSRYILTFIDHFSRYTWVFFLNAKSDTFSAFKAWHLQVTNETKKPLSCLRTDRGGEYLSHEFQAYCTLHGIRCQLTAAGTPQQNGIAERKNRYLMETTRSLLFGANLPTYLWEEAVKTACYLTNRVPTRALHRLTPFEVYTGTRPNLSHLRVFGSAAYIHIQKRHKLAPKSRQYVLVGYDHQTKGYRCLDYINKKIVISRNVLFDETILGIPHMTAPPSSADDILRAFFDTNTPTPSSPQLHSPTLSVPQPPATSLPSTPVSHSSPPNPNSFPISTPDLLTFPEPENHSPTPAPPAPHRSLRSRLQNVRLDDYVLSISVDDHDVCLTKVASSLPNHALTYTQAAQHPDWQAAMEDEITSIHKNETWDLVPLPVGKKAITSKWVYKVKPGLNGAADRFKARLVARGFEQQYGVDFEETFAPVVKWSTIRALTARAAYLGHQIHHLDVKTAFLYGKITDELSMVQPPGFQIPGKAHLVCKMNKALYGLRQSPRMWYERIDTYLRTLGLTRSHSDYNMYYLGTGVDRLVLVLYVDDLFISGDNQQQIQWLKSQLYTQFDMTDLGFVTKYLGVEFRRLPDGSYHISQTAYINDILHEFDMLQANPEHVPLPPSSIYSQIWIPPQ